MIDSAEPTSGQPHYVENVITEVRLRLLKTRIKLQKSKLIN